VNVLWMADTTFVPTDEGFQNLGVVLDVFSRRIVGRAMSNHLYTELMLRALDMVLQQRRHEGVILHSDRDVRGGFNRLMQHRIVEQISGNRPELPQASSIQESFAALSSTY
jgi:transposase InsO family protein